MSDMIDIILLNPAMHYVLMVCVMPLYAFMYQQTKLLSRIHGKVDVLCKDKVRNDS